MPKTKPQAAISLMSPPPTEKPSLLQDRTATDKYGSPVTTRPEKASCSLISGIPVKNIKIGIQSGISRLRISQTAAIRSKAENSMPFNIGMLNITTQVLYQCCLKCYLAMSWTFTSIIVTSIFRLSFTIGPTSIHRRTDTDKLSDFWQTAPYFASDPPLIGWSGLW